MSLKIIKYNKDSFKIYCSCHLSVELYANGNQSMQLSGRKVGLTEKLRNRHGIGGKHQANFLSCASRLEQN